MELKLNKEEICSTEVIFSARQEQSAELDYVLPDYCPEIFKIIKCCADPRVSSYGVSGERLTYELCLSIRVLYCTEGSAKIQLIEQKLNYTKSVELGYEASDADVSITPRLDYINCRAVNQRRIDIRGALSVDIRVLGCKKNELVCDAFGMGMQLHKLPVTYPAKRIGATGQLSVSEQFDLGMTKPAVENIIWYDAAVISTDRKIIANKLVAKGELALNVLYSSAESESAETMEFTVPFSKIVDMEGIDERFECSVDAEITSCDVVPKADGDGNSKILECFAGILIKCQAFHSETVEIADDDYSTVCESSDEKCEVRVDMPPRPVMASSTVKTTVTSGESLTCVYGLRSRLKEYSASVDKDNGGIVISGVLCVSVLGCGNDKMPVSADKEESFTISVPVDDIGDNTEICVKVFVLTQSYNLASENEIDVKVELKVCGTVRNTMTVLGITDITADENTPAARDGDYAVKLYFADSDEPLWGIAKRYRTSVDAIIDENNIDGDLIRSSGMIIIPIV